MTFGQRIGGPLMDLADLGIRTKDCIAASPSYEHTTESVAGMDGLIDLGSKRNPRSIRALFKFVSEDWIDFARIRDEIFTLFDGKTPFYLIDKRQPFKRWKVKTDGEYEISR